MVDRALVEVGLLGRHGTFGNVDDLGRRVDEEVGDRINVGLTMDQPEEVEVGCRASSLLFLSVI